MTLSHRLILLAVFGVCLLASGFLSGSETAFTALPKERLPQLAGAGRRGRLLEKLVKDLEGTIGVILVANNFVNILATSVAALLAIGLVGESLGTALSTVSVTILVLVFGEVTPKMLAARHPERYGSVAAGPVWALRAALRPVSRLFTGAGRALIRLLRAPPPEAQGATLADVRALAILGERSGEIEPGEREIIERLFETADQPVRDVMTPRMDMVTLALPVAADAVRAAAAGTAHSRFPVVGEDGNPDSIRGILHAKDVLIRGGALTEDEVAALLRPPHYVPESAPVMRVLNDLRSRRTGMAVVMDEHGGVEGLVTVKDLVGELVGQLQDEYDPRAPVILPVGRGVWLADGRAPVDDLEAAAGVQVEDGPYSTAAGLFLYLSGRIPAAGDEVEYGGLTLTVLAMDRRQIAKLRVQKPPPE